MACRWARVRAPVAAASLVICGPHLHRTIRGAQRLTASQLDLPSLTPLSVVGCGILQLGAPQLATSVALLQVVDN